MERVRSQLRLYGGERPCNWVKNCLRALDAYIDTLDLGALGFKHTETGTVAGQPPYNPWAMLKLYLYGYQQGIRSSRVLESRDPKEP